MKTIKKSTELPIDSDQFREFDSLEDPDISPIVLGGVFRGIPHTLYIPSKPYPIQPVKKFTKEEIEKLQDVLKKQGKL